MREWRRCVHGSDIIQPGSSSQLWFFEKAGPIKDDAQFQRPPRKAAPLTSGQYSIQTQAHPHYYIAWIDSGGSGVFGGTPAPQMVRNSRHHAIILF